MENKAHALAAGLFVLISKTRLGMRIRAGESDREMIGALGVDIRTLYTLVFALAVMVCVGIGRTMPVGRTPPRVLAVPSTLNRSEPEGRA